MMRSFALLTLALATAPAALTAQQAQPQGTPAAEASATDRPQSDAVVELDASLLSAGTDTFDIIVQGRTVGAQVVNLEAADGGYVLTQTVTTPMAQQTTEVRFGSDLSMQSLDQTGTSSGQEMSIQVEYIDGSAKGSVKVGDAPEKEVDVEVPSNVIDDNAFMALLPTMPFAPETSFSIPVMGAGPGKVTSVTLSVTGEEQVIVPSGTFDVYAVEMLGAPQTLNLYVTKEAPHRLVKLAVAGAPFAFVLSGSTR